MEEGKTESKTDTPSPVAAKETDARFKDRLFAHLRELIAKEVQFSNEEIQVFFDGIRVQIDRKYRFSSDQMDTGIEISLPVLPARDQKLFREIGQHSHVSLWQTNWAQFRRNHENGLAFSLLLDPGWRSGDLYGFPEVVCEVCHKTFIPDTLGGRFCSNKCGAEEERIRLGLPTREAQLVELEAAKSKEERVKEADDQLREQSQKQDKQVEVAGA